ncbi:L-ascorbate oxidase-like protein [Senna tora]|uniref:L-ascorbate oxidase-like protein n=1 Tax=Senna tora TaxID=362788 RepID=A0A834WRD6_9FABA|nr:L-ascorbate oxidase-like protein [Senna tora]
MLTPIQVRNIQSHSIRFKSQGTKHHNFEIGEASRPLILNPKNKVSRPWDWWASRPLILSPRNKASRPWDLWGIETPDFKTKEQGIETSNFKSKEQGISPLGLGIEIPKNLNPRNQASRPGDWQGIEIPKNLNPRDQASRPGDWQGIEIPKILNPRNQTSRTGDWQGIKTPKILNPRNQASRPGDWQGIKIPEILNPRNQASRPEGWQGIEIPKILNPRNQASKPGGNLLLLNSSNLNILWQSFDYLTDTLLPGMNVGVDFTSGMSWSLRSWKNKEDPSPGVLSLEVEEDDNYMYEKLIIRIKKGSQIYWIGDELSNFMFQSYNRQSNTIRKQGPNGVLINGKNAKGDGKDEVVYTMKAGKTYKYRFCNVGIKNTINVKFQNHPMKLIEMERSHTIQNNYESLDIHVGQCFTVLVTADKEPKDYYLVASTSFYKSTVIGKVVIRYKNGKGHASPELPEAPVGWACSLNHFHTFRWNLTTGAARPSPQGSYKYGSIPINMTIKLQLDGLAGKLR